MSDFQGRGEHCIVVDRKVRNDFPSVGNQNNGRISVLRLASVDCIGGAIITIGLLMFMFALTVGNVVGWVHEMLGGHRHRYVSRLRRICL